MNTYTDTHTATKQARERDTGVQGKSTGFDGQVGKLPSISGSERIQAQRHAEFERKISYENTGGSQLEDTELNIYYFTHLYERARVCEPLCLN